MAHAISDLMSNDWLNAIPGGLDQFKATRIPRILLADDEVAARVLMSALLRRMNVKVDVAHDGQEVLWLYQKFDFDLILLDIDMPVMNGFVTARRIRESEKDGHRTPIIAVSGYLAETADRKSEHHHFDGTVAKPVTLARLWSAIAQHLPRETCSEPTSVLRTASAEVPLLNLAAFRTTQLDEAGQGPGYVVQTTINELRRLAGNLHRSMAEGERRESVTMTAVELGHLAERIGAPRLQRRASAMAAIPPEVLLEEWQAQAQGLIACTVATISELKKLTTATT